MPAEFPADDSLLGSPLKTVFTHHLGERLHVVTFARPSPAVATLALSVHRAGGVLNVLGARDDVLPVPAALNFHEGLRPDLDFKFAYGQVDGVAEKELGYRQVIFKRMLFVWRLASQLPPHDLVLYVDGEDVFFQRHLDVLLASWRDLMGGVSTGREAVLFMGCPDCGSRFHGHREITYPIPGSPRGVKRAAACARWRGKQPNGTLPFLDSGGYLGRAHMVREVLRDALTLAWAGLDFFCMSALTVAGIRLGPSKLRVDTEARLFYSVVPRRRFDTLANFTPEVGRPLCARGYFDRLGEPPPFLPTGSTPAVLHFAGGSKWYWLKRCHAMLREHFVEELAEAAKKGRLPVVRMCHFSDFNCEPCTEEVPDCSCIACQSLEDTFAYIDVDRRDVLRMQFEAVRQIVES